MYDGTDVGRARKFTTESTFFTLGGSHKVGGMRIKVSAEQFAQTEGLKGRAVLRVCGEKISTFFLNVRIEKSR